MPTDPLDDATVRNLAAALDAPPIDLIAVSQGLWAWRTIDSELAELEQERDLTGGVRSNDVWRAYTFVLDDDVAVEARYDLSTSTLVVDTEGWAAEVRLRQVGRPDVVDVPDEAGVCTFSAVPSGTSQLEFVPRDASPVRKTPPFGL